MARGINKVILVGNLGADPQVRYTPPPDSVAITNLTIATSRSWKNKQTGQQEEQTEWHKVVLFNRLAEIGAEYLRKGSKVYIEGSLRTRKWQDANGQDRYSTEIVANELQMLDSRTQGRDASTSADENNYSSSPLSNFSASSVATSTESAGAGQNNNFDDDIPF